MTELATIEHNTLALDSDQSWWTDRQMAGLRQMGVEEATEGDLLVFFHVCQRTGLDPFARQIHMVSRNQKDGDRWIKKWTIQTGIDGYRLIARRASDRLGETLEYEDTAWCDAEGTWADVWLKGTAPTAAKVAVLRHGKRFPGVALYREFVQTKRDGNPNAMWSRMPANQLAKCAEALALRKAFPQDLSGIYTDDEMAQADRPERREPEQQPRSGRERMDQILNVEQVHPEPSGAEAAPVAPETAPVEPDGNSAPESPLLNTSGKLAKHMFALFGEVGLTERDERLAYVNDVIQPRMVETSAEMTDADAEAVIAALQRDADQ